MMPNIRQQSYHLVFSFESQGTCDVIESKSFAVSPNVVVQILMTQKVNVT